jgi:hypothetical protein
MGHPIKGQPQVVHYHMNYPYDAIPGEDCEECRDVLSAPPIPTPEERMKALTAEARDVAAQIAALMPIAQKARRDAERSVRSGQTPQTIDRKRAAAEEAEDRLAQLRARRDAIDAEMVAIYDRQHDAYVDEQMAIINSLLALVPEGIETRSDASVSYPCIDLTAPGNSAPVKIYGPRPIYGASESGLTISGWRPSTIGYYSSSPYERPETAMWMAKALTAAVAIAKAWDAARGIEG